MNKIAIVILSWNGLSLTRRCVESLGRSELPSDTRVVVVDNGSSDGTVEYLSALEHLQVIANDKNLGYAKAVNIGISAVPEDFDILLLNNDVELIEPDWLVRLQATAYTNERTGIVGAKILRDDGVLQHCGAYIPIDTYWGQQLAGGELDINQYSGVFPVESVVFACAYIKRSTIEQIGLLSEDFFAYFEDSDYCLRAKRAGLQTLMDGTVRILHSENSSTKVNKVSHTSIFLASQKTFKKKWSRYLESERYTSRIDWHSIINFPSGYGGTCRSLVEAMDRSGVRVAYKYVYGRGPVFPPVEPEHSSSYIVNCVRGRPFGESPVQVVYAQGDVFERNSGNVKIGYTMLEVDGLPVEWVRQANLMDEVWVPSRFNVETFVSSGVRTPVRTMPLGIDAAYFAPEMLGRKPRETFTFLSIFEWGDRKAPEILLRAFADEFQKTEPVALVCKVNNFDPSVDVRAEVRKARLARDGGRIVLAINQILEHYELGALYASADCFVLPTRGEGWGMPILEAMASGLPVIATNWSAQTDFMTEENAFPIDVARLVPAVAKCPYYAGFRWAEPSYEHLRYLMRYVYENQAAARAVGLRAADEVRARWTWQNAARAIMRRIDEF
jgi:GT2 family glycosyltransferase